MNLQFLNENYIIMSNHEIPYYKQIGKEVEIFEHAFQKKLPLLLKGPTGAG
jgi:nitric oxide reductase NorQ protein